MYVYTGESRVADRLGAGQSCIGPATSCIVWYFQWTDMIIAGQSCIGPATSCIVWYFQWTDKIIAVHQGGWQPEAQFELDGDSSH